jgi:hypothetical protein
VTIAVTTDGETVTALSRQSGPPMLVKFTEENIRSWRLSKHQPTTFVSTFHYVIEGPDQCSYTNDASMLRLPLEARIVAKGVMTCDADGDVRPHP